MSKDTTTIKLDPGNLRIFVKGVDITDLVKSAVVETQTSFAEHLSDGFIDLKTPLTEYHSITLELNLNGSKIEAGDNAHVDIHVGDYPTDEFIAEMVRLKFRRAGLLK